MGIIIQLTGILGMDVLEECWREVTDEALPQAVRDYIDAYWAEAGEDERRS